MAPGGICICANEYFCLASNLVSQPYELLRNNSHLKIVSACISKSLPFPKGIAKRRSFINTDQSLRIYAGSLYYLQIYEAMRDYEIEEAEAHSIGQSEE